jgi:hypothetical protein
VSLGYAILDLSLAGVGKLLGLISGKGAHLADNFPQFVISTGLLQIGLHSV